jgi:hypothetical protein
MTNIYHYLGLPLPRFETNFTVEVYALLCSIYERALRKLKQEHRNWTHENRIQVPMYP